MPSPLIFKHRQRNPRSFVKSISGAKGLSANVWAYNYVLYMGRREGVVKHDTENHGLFGRLDHNNTGAFGIIDNINAAANYAKKKVEDGTYVYDNVMSIDAADFARLGYDDSPAGVAAWQRLVKDNVCKLAAYIKIPAHQVEYVAALHIDKGKPNLHILFWDSKQGVVPYYNYKKTGIKMRDGLIKYVYEDDIKEFSEEKTRARDAMIKSAARWNNETFGPLYIMSKADFKNIKDSVDADPAAAAAKLLNRSIPNVYLDEMRVKIIQVMDALPTKGRLAFGFLPPDVKREVAELTEDIIKEMAATNADFKNAFKDYKKAARNMAKLYNAETLACGSINPAGKAAIDKAEKTAEDDLTKRLANRLLKCILAIDRNQYIHGKAEYTGRQNINAQRNTTMNLLAAVFRSITQEHNMPQRKPRLRGTTDRIEARRDALKNMEVASSSYEL